MNKRFYFRNYLLLIAYAGTILISYLYPINTEKTINRYYIMGIRSDYWLHMLLFFPLPLLIKGISKKGMKEWIFLTLVCFCIAIIAEGIHYVIPYRSFNPLDMLANTVGILLATLFITLPRSIIHHYKK